MKKGCTGLLRSSAGLGGPADPLVGLLDPVLGMLLGASLSVSRDVGGEISSEFAPCAFERSPPHLFLYLLLFNKTKVQTSKDSAGCKHRGVYTFIEQVFEKA